MRAPGHKPEKAADRNLRTSQRIAVLAGRFAFPRSFPKPTASVCQAPPLTENGRSFLLTAGLNFDGANK